MLKFIDNFSIGLSKRFFYVFLQIVEADIFLININTK